MRLHVISGVCQSLFVRIGLHSIWIVLRRKAFIHMVVDYWGIFIPLDTLNDIALLVLRLFTVDNPLWLFSSDGSPGVPRLSFSCWWRFIRCLSRPVVDRHIVHIWYWGSVTCSLRVLRYR